MTDEPRLTEEELAEMELLDVHTPLQRQCVRLAAEVRRLRALIRDVVPLMKVMAIEERGPEKDHEIAIADALVRESER